MNGNRRRGREERHPNFDIASLERQSFGGERHFREFSRPVSTVKHKAKCSDCGQECEVPFLPAPGKPVYCRACFPKHKLPKRF